MRRRFRGGRGRFEGGDATRIRRRRFRRVSRSIDPYTRATTATTRRNDIGKTENSNRILVKTETLLSKLHDIRRTPENAGSTVPSSIGIEEPFSQYGQDCILLRIKADRISRTVARVPHQYFEKVVVGMLRFDYESRVLPEMQIEVVERVRIKNHHGEVAGSVERRNVPDKIMKNLSPKVR